MTLFNMQSTRHRDNRKVARAHQPVCEYDDVTVLRNQAVHTDREIVANRQDTIIKNRKETTCIVIDVDMPVDRNVKQKGSRKETKTQQRKWNMKRMIIQVMITGATRIITIGLKENVGSHTRKTFIVFTTKHNCTWNIAHNAET